MNFLGFINCLDCSYSTEKLVGFYAKYSKTQSASAWTVG
jgi:hypothetical protein